MSALYKKIIDYLPHGLTNREGAALIEVSEASFRGMIRDLRKMIPVETTYSVANGKRLATHSLREDART